MKLLSSSSPSVLYTGHESITMVVPGRVQPESEFVSIKSIIFPFPTPTRKIYSKLSQYLTVLNCPPPNPNITLIFTLIVIRVRDVSTYLFFLKKYSTSYFLLKSIVSSRSTTAKSLLEESSQKSWASFPRKHNRAAACLHPF